MTTPVASPVTPSDPQGPVAVVRAPENVAAKAAPSEAKPTQAELQIRAHAPASDTRLVIEEDKETRTYIYKTLDRQTGEVLQQFPREQVLRLREEPGYTPGQVLRART
jgi:flagellar protein FlaG